MIVVIATMHSKVGKEKETLAFLQSLIAPTHREEGCIQYDLHVAAEDAAAFAFYERWTSKAALDAHLASPHLAAAFARVPELLEEAPEIKIYQLVS